MENGVKGKNIVEGVFVIKNLLIYRDWALER